MSCVCKDISYPFCILIQNPRDFIRSICYMLISNSGSVKWKNVSNEVRPLLKASLTGFGTMVKSHGRYLLSLE